MPREHHIILLQQQKMMDARDAVKTNNNPFLCSLHVALIHLPLSISMVTALCTAMLLLHSAMLFTWFTLYRGIDHLLFSFVTKSHTHSVINLFCGSFISIPKGIWLHYQRSVHQKYRISYCSMALIGC